MAFTDFGNQAAPTQQVASQQLVGQTVDRAGSEEEEKQGLLGRIMPFIQSMGMAAAFGANPLAGLLVGPQIIQKGRDLAKVGNEERRFQLQQRQRAEIARDRLPGLLQDPRQGQLAQSLLDIGNPQLTSGLLGSRTNTTTQKFDAFRQEGISRGLTGQPLLDFVDAGMKGRDGILEAILARQDQVLGDQRIAAGIEDQRVLEAEKTGRSNSAGNLVSNLIRLDDINDELFNLPEGVFEQAIMAPGSVVPPGAQKFATSALSLAGNESAERARTLQGQFDQLTPELVFDRIEGGVQADSQAEFRQLSSTKPTLQEVGPANEDSLLRNLRAVLLLPDLRPADRRAAENKIRAIEKRQKGRGNRPPTPAEAAAELARREAAGG